MNTRELEQWRRMVSRSWCPVEGSAVNVHPYDREDDDNDREDEVSNRGIRAMWVYQRTERSLWTVGYYAPNGEWHTDSDYSDKNEAAERVHYLNGGR